MHIRGIDYLCPMNKNLSIDEGLIKSLYEQGVSIAEIAKQAECGRSSVHNVINRLGLGKRLKEWTNEEISILKDAYQSDLVKAIDLNSIAKKLGRNRMAVALKANDLGLCQRSGRTKYPDYAHLEPKKRHAARTKKTSSKEELSKLQSENAKRSIAQNGHPRGMLGKTHSEENKQAQGQRASALWTSMTDKQKSELIGKGLKTKLKKYGTLAPERNGTTWKSGWREIGGFKKYYRSRWEANYARFLEWSRQQGHIKEWLHEPDTFWFHNILRGTRSYLPDFKVTSNDGTIAYHEVKGWMDPASKTKLKRMKKYYPEVRIELIDSKRYNTLKKQVSRIIKDWE